MSEYALGITLKKDELNTLIKALKEYKKRSYVFPNQKELENNLSIKLDNLKKLYRQENLTFYSKEQRNFIEQLIKINGKVDIEWYIQEVHGENVFCGYFIAKKV